MEMGSGGFGGGRLNFREFRRFGGCLTGDCLMGRGKGMLTVGKLVLGCR